jgi:hypothetical protein
VQCLTSTLTRVHLNLPVLDRTVFFGSAGQIATVDTATGQSPTAACGSLSAGQALWQEATCQTRPVQSQTFIQQVACTVAA